MMDKADLFRFAGTLRDRIDAFPTLARTEKGEIVSVTDKGQCGRGFDLLNAQANSRLRAHDLVDEFEKALRSNEVGQ